MFLVGKCFQILKGGVNFVALHLFSSGLSRLKFELHSLVQGAQNL